MLGLYCKKAPAPCVGGSLQCNVDGVEETTLPGHSSNGELDERAEEEGESDQSGGEPKAKRRQQDTARSGSCPHGRRKSQCKECGGSQICPHGRRKNLCKECGGSGLCPHGRQKSVCKECGGSQICPHGRQKSRCKECGRSRIRGQECARVVSVEIMLHASFYDDSDSGVAVGGPLCTGHDFPAHAASVRVGLEQGGSPVSMEGSTRSSSVSTYFRNEPGGGAGHGCDGAQFATSVGQYASTCSARSVCARARA